jgi:glycerol-3-phosphate responsive antiterminator
VSELLLEELLSKYPENKTKIKNYTVKMEQSNNETVIYLYSNKNQLLKLVKTIKYRRDTTFVSIDVISSSEFEIRNADIFVYFVPDRTLKRLINRIINDHQIFSLLIRYLKLKKELEKSVNLSSELYHVIENKLKNIREKLKLYGNILLKTETKNLLGDQKLIVDDVEIFARFLLLDPQKLTLMIVVFHLAGFNSSFPKIEVEISPLSSPSFLYKVY